MPENVIGYTNSDFAGSKPDQKSTEEYIFMLEAVAISHLSKVQSIIALSTFETKYDAMCEA